VQEVNGALEIDDSDDDAWIAAQNAKEELSHIKGSRKDLTTREQEMEVSE